MKNVLFAIFKCIVIVFSIASTTCVSSRIGQEEMTTTYLGKDDSGFKFYIENQVLLKVKQDSEIVYRYPMKRYSQNIHVDWNNPFKILLHYQDFNKIDFLDRELNLLNTLDLNEFKWGRIHSVANAGQNGYWVYSDIQFKIFKLNENLDLLQEIDVQLFLDNAQDVVSLYQKRDKLYILTDDEIITLSENGQLINRCQLETPDSNRKMFELNGELYIIDNHLAQKVNCKN